MTNIEVQQCSVLALSKTRFEQLEKVQRCFIKRLFGMNILSRDDQLNHLCLPTLELLRLHLDLIYCYKVVFGLMPVNFP